MRDSTGKIFFGTSLRVNYYCRYQIGQTLARVQVSAGAEVAVVEAMKMRNSVRTATGGTVKVIHFNEGASLAHQSVILEFE